MHKKACKKIYSLQILRRAGVDRESTLEVYLTTITPIMEYAVPRWQSIPVSLSDKHIRVSLSDKLIHPAESYNIVLQPAQIDSLSTKRHQPCVKCMDKIGLNIHPLHSLLPRQVGSNCPYGLRNMKDYVYLFRNCERCTTK